MKSFREICDALHIPLERDLPIRRHVVDSREVQRGDLFYALPGERTAGIHYLQEVYERGGFGAIVPQEYTGPDYGLTLIRVSDVLSTLHDLAKHQMNTRGANIIGVTGSVGKTTTKEFIATILSQKYAVFQTKDNQNTQSHFPLNLLNCDKFAEIFVLEMGMTHPGHIATLANIAPPDMVVMTPITYVHFKNFTDIEEIAKAKSEIFVPSTKFALLHESAARYEAIQTASSHAETQIYPASSQWKKHSPLAATHLADNVVAACKLAEYIGMTEIEIKKALPKVQPHNHRFQQKERNGITFIDDSYNATYESMAAALTNLPAGQRHIGVLGSMAELGAMSEVLHQKLGDVAKKHLDYLLCIGTECKPMVESCVKTGMPVEWFSDYAEMKQRMHSILQTGDVVLLKGSNYHKLWEFIDPC